MRYFIGDRTVTGVPDTGPDGERRLRDRPGDRFGVERGEITPCPAPAYQDHELRVEGAEPRQSGDNLRRAPQVPELSTARNGPRNKYPERSN